MKWSGLPIVARLTARVPEQASVAKVLQMNQAIRSGPVCDEDSDYKCVVVVILLEPDRLNLWED